MIPFDQIDARLEQIGKSRAWLAENTGRSPGSIRAALAPNAVPKQRTALLQKALTDAIEKEQERQRSEAIVQAPSLHLPDRITIECDPAERRNWQAAAQHAQLDLDRWAVQSLNTAAEQWFTPSQGKKDGTNGR